MGIFTKKEQAALAPQRKLKPSEWAELYRFLPSSVTAEPGRYKNARTPYIAGIIDAILEPTVLEIIVLKAAQVGYTTALQNLIGWCVDHEPGPMLLVMPNEKEAGKIIKENIDPLIDNCPQLQSHLTVSRSAEN